LLQEEYGVENKFLVYNHSTLTSQPKKTMQTLINKTGLDYENTLIKPTIAGNDWLGNSHYGPTKGISNNISKNYRKVLRVDEFNKISALTDSINEHITDKKTPVNLLDIPSNTFYDYKTQKKYFNNKEKIVLYYALTNSTKRRYKITKAPIYAFSAIIFSFLVRILHIPRMLKLRYLKGKGKQNYT